MKFDMEKDEWYYQPKIYIDRKDTNSLYYELKEFRLSLSDNKEALNELFDESFLKKFSENGKEVAIKKLKNNPHEICSKGILNKKNQSIDSAGFFEDKLKVLKDEIEDINKNLEERQGIEIEFTRMIESEIKELERHLHEISNWQKGDKSSIEFIRMELLRQVLSLKKEIRMNKLSFWKDRVFEKRDRRNLIFEYKSMKWMTELAFEKMNGVGYGVAK